MEWRLNKRGMTKADAITILSVYRKRKIVEILDYSKAKIHIIYEGVKVTDRYNWENSAKEMEKVYTKVYRDS